MPGREQRRDVTYVALVHGVATQDPDVWATELLSRVIRRWSEREEYVVTTRRCDDECPLHPGRHRHLVITRDGLTEQVDLEAVYWGSLVQPGPWPVALRQTFHIGGAVLLADFTAVWSALVGGNTYRSATRDRPGLVLAVGRLLSFLVRVVAAPLIVAALIALVCTRRFRLAVADVYEWMTDDDVRSAIVATVTDSVHRARAERVCLVGHSQGGSVVMQARKILVARGDMTARDPVTTFGNADPLLHTVQRFGIQSGLGRYWLLVAALWVLSVVVAIVPAFGLLSLVILAGKLAGAALLAGGAVWLLPAGGTAVPTDLGAAVAGFAALRGAGEVTGLAVVPAVLATAVIGLVLNAAGLSRRILAGPAPPGSESDGSAPGHDVVARDDPLAPLARAVGSRSRLRQIPQTSSILLDHEAYFRNSATAVPVMFGDIWHRIAPDAGQAGGGAGDGSVDDSGSVDGSVDFRILISWYRTGLRARRLTVFLLWAAAAGGGAALGAATGSAALGFLAVLAVSGGAAWIRLVLLWRWMERMDTSARTGPHVVARAVRRRRTHRSTVFTVALIVAAILALGGAVVAGDVRLSGATAAPSAAAAWPPGMFLALLTVGAGLVAAAAGSRSGAVLFDAAGMTCLVAFSALWLVHGPTGWIAVAVAAAVSAYRAVTLVRETL